MTPNLIQLRALNYYIWGRLPIKRDLITKAKMAKSPAGLGVVGESSN
jgi:hypothetical protein